MQGFIFFSQQNRNKKFKDSQWKVDFLDFSVILHTLTKSIA